MSDDISGTSWDQCRSMVQCSFTSTETRRLLRTDSPGRSPRLSHSSWTMAVVLIEGCLYNAILRSWADSLHSHVILQEWLAFYNAFFESLPKWCTYSAGMDSAIWNCSRLGASSVYTVYTIQPCTVSLHVKSHIRKVYACLAVTCH